jgi:hypothetical protein
MPSSACIKPDDDAASSVATDTRMMQQAQPKSAARRADSTTVRSSSWPIRRVGTLLSTSFREGHDIVVVAELMGHKRLDQTRRYSLPTQADRENAILSLPTDR